MNDNEHTEAMRKKIPEKIYIKLRSFASSLAGIIERTLVVPEKALRWTIIANPGAGGFTINRRWEKHQAALSMTLEKAQQNPRHTDAFASKYSRSDTEKTAEELGAYGLIPTSGPGHAGKIAEALLAEMADDKENFHLFITAGGDGTSLEVLQTIYHASPGLQARCAVLRLPLGTGNDGADAGEMADALKLLISPTNIVLSRGLELSTASGKTQESGIPFLAFNILSVGLDAFVTHMTNKMKGKLPGDSYKLWVDISALLYDRIYKVDFMKVKCFDEKQKEIKQLHEKILLCAVGISGHRSYGSHKWILPDERNVCIIKQMPLLRKLVLKEQFNCGTHVNKPETILFNAARIEISGNYPILAQMDGETVRLEKSDFPAVIELTKPRIPILKLIANELKNIL